MIKQYFSNTYDRAKQEPLIYAGMFFLIAYGFITTTIGGFQLSFFIGFTGAYLLIFGITKFTSYQQYKTIQTFDNKDAIKETELLVTKRIAIVTAILSFMHFSFVIVVTFFHKEDPANYTLFMIYWIGGFAIANIIISVINAIRARKNNSSIFKCLKLIDLSNTLISLSLAQRTIIHFAGHPQATLISAIGGIFFSLCAFAVCLFMFKKVRVNR